MSSIYDNLDTKDLNILRNSLRYFRLARQSKSIEQKLLNTWIAVESLYIKSESHEDNLKTSLIENIIHYVPMIYNSLSIAIKIRYAKKLLSSNKIEINDEIKNKLNLNEKYFSESTADDTIWKIMQQKDLFKSLVNNIDILEHLKYRLDIIHKFCQDKNISKNFEKSKLRVERQLYRIYYMRNKIAHSGHYNNINYNLLTHLMDYLIISYSAIVVGSKKLHKIAPNEEFSILDIFSYYELEYNNLIENIKSKDINNFKDVYINAN